MLISITIGSLEHMGTCLNSHLGRHNNNNLYKINYIYVLNLHVDRLRSEFVNILCVYYSVTTIHTCGNSILY